MTLSVGRAPGGWTPPVPPDSSASSPPIVVESGCDSRGGGEGNYLARGSTPRLGRGGSGPHPQGALDGRRREDQSERSDAKTAALQKMTVGRFGFADLVGSTKSFLEAY